MAFTYIKKKWKESSLRNVVVRVAPKDRSKITKQNNQKSEHSISISRSKDLSDRPIYSDRFAWRAGLKLLAIQNNNKTECIIIKISKADLNPFIPTMGVTVQFEDGSIEQFDRMSNKIQSHPDFIANRQKLTRCCCIERYSLSQKQWISAYIDKCKTNTSATNDRTFYVNRKKYNEWSPNIRCSAKLLDLVRGSMILIFDGDSALWCFGKIIDIVQVQMKQNEKYLDVVPMKQITKSLDIFKIHYQKNGKMYLKYGHQFSASIGIIDNNMCAAYTMNERDISLLLHGFVRKNLAVNNDVLSVIRQYIECLQELDVAMNERDIKKAKMTEIDSIDLKYHRLLLCGSIRKSSNDDGDIFINMDVLSIMVKYIGLFYELVMVIEAKTYSLANMTPKASIHNGRIPSPSKNIESDKSDVEDDESTYSHSIHALEVQTDYEEDESLRNECTIHENEHDSSDDNSFSLKSEQGLTVQSDWESTSDESQSASIGSVNGQNGDGDK